MLVYIPIYVDHLPAQSLERGVDGSEGHHDLCEIRSDIISLLVEGKEPGISSGGGIELAPLPWSLAGVLLLWASD